jgi:mRNA interferase RelE/StbE
VPYRIELRPRARKAFLALDKPVKRRVGDAIEALADEPRPAGVKPLKGLPGVLRIRVADDYRVVYRVDDARLVVTVLDVGHRREIYR